MDPVTAAKVVKIAYDRIKDEESRRKTGMMIIGLILFIIAIFTVGTYILQNPIEVLLKSFNESTIKKFREKYGEAPSDTVGNADIEIDFDEIEYDDVTMTSGETKVVYYNQGDSAWGSMLYGTIRPISSSGCGPTSMAIVISTLKEKIIPPEACKWSVEHGYLVQGYNNGKGYAMSSHGLIPGMAKEFGLKCKGVGKGSNTAEQIMKGLANGKLVVAIMGPGHFTSGGHFVVLRGVTKKGRILVADCGSYSRSKKEWDLNLIIREARNGAGAGGPFWIISK